nr:hypothetical protein [Novosphingobium sp. BW1]
MVTGPSGQLRIAQFRQFAADARLVERHRELFVEPMRQVDQPPAHEAMDRRARPALDRLDQCASLRIIEDRCLAWGLTVQQPVRTAVIETDYPVADDLKGDTPNPRCLAPLSRPPEAGRY